MNRPAMLIILDGWGINENVDGNAVKMAKTPFLDSLKAKYPNSNLKCSGEAVGLPSGFMGNSEVGHLNIGAGKIVYQDLLRINNSIKDESFKKNETICNHFSNIKEKGGSLHLIGLLSDGGVHSHINHLFAAIDLAQTFDIKIYIHPILDGRDTPPDCGVNYLGQLQKHIQGRKNVSIATMCGRFYAMDRDTRWDRVEKAYNLYTTGDGKETSDIESAILSSYKAGETDEFIKPHLFDKNGVIKDNDGVFFFNFRADRAREISNAFINDDFKGFKRINKPTLSGYLCMTSFDENLKTIVAFPPQKLKGILGEVISHSGLSQFRLAETEKYAHVTYFFNGGEEEPFPLEERLLVESPRDVATYDEKPEMSAFTVAEKAVDRIAMAKDSLIVINFANMDMVGHTGILDKAVKAVETVDLCVEKVVTKALEKGFSLFITADHGNAEEMISNNKPHTAHTLNHVPFIFVSEERREVKNGSLCDIAPTILDYMGIEKSKEMDGNSLFV